MGSSEGCQKRAAHHLGITYEEYKAKVAAGLKWCTACKVWQDRSLFRSDASRGDGLKVRCAPAELRVSKISKANYESKRHAERWGPNAGNMIGRHDHSGAKNSRWKGGRKIRGDGYVLVKVPKGHRLSQSNGYAFEHRLASERAIGRELRPGEVVHHKNGNRSDNEPGNLSVMDDHEHKSFHRKEFMR